MPVFEITSPDGKTFEITAPDGATKEQALEYAKSQFANQEPVRNEQRTYGDLIKSIPGQVRKGVTFGGPLGAALAYGNATSDILAKGAYDVGGKVTELAAKTSLSPEAAAGVGFATNIGLQSIPVIASMGIGRAASPVMEEGARRVMQSAVKPTVNDLRSGKAARAIQTMLDEGINATPGGMAELKRRIADLNRQIASEIQGSSASIDHKAAAWGPIKDALDKFSRQVDPAADISAIKSTWENFTKAHPLILQATQSGDTIPVQLAQQIKQGTYSALSKKYGQLGGAEVEAQKAIARGLKEGISDAVPSISRLNAKDSELINALNVAERRALAGLNNNPAGLTLLADSPGKMAAFMADKSNLFKSLVARMINAGSRTVPEAVTGTAAAITQGVKNKEQ
jgi:hypothetical protein